MRKIICGTDDRSLGVLHNGEAVRITPHAPKRGVHLQDLKGDAAPVVPIKRMAVTLMDLAIPAGGGIVARVLHAALKGALKRQEALISESELAQVARVIVVGSNNTVSIAPPVGMPSSTRGGYDIDQIVARCFEIVLSQPGLSVIYAINKDGERFIKIENMRNFQLPDESQLTVYNRGPKDTPGGYQQPNKIENTQEKPTTVDGTEDAAGEDSTSARSRHGSRTAREYAEYARRMMELPDDPDGVDPEKVL